MKYKVFEKELSYINDDRLRENAKTILNNLPDYFYKIQAASTGKYHPNYALGDGGLVRHTKAAVSFANNLFNIYKLDNHTKDLIVISLLIHDGLKSGLVKEKYTRVDHPLLISNYIKENKDKLEFTDEEIEFICQNVESHMGEWNTDFNGNEVLPLPKNRYQKFVHMCDFLASRKFLNVEFDGNEIK